MEKVAKGNNKRILTPDEINARLASTRDQKFRRMSQNRIDGLARMSAEFKYKAKTPEGKEKLRKRNQHPNFKNRDISFWKSKEGKEKIRQIVEKRASKMDQIVKKAKETFLTNLESNLKSLKKGAIKRWSDEKFRKRRTKELIAEKGIRCQVKPLNGKWQTFDSFKIAAKFFKWNDLGGTPKSYFPEDGSTKTGVKGKRKGWQTRRLL
jgi:hypothetical protein